MDDRWTDRPVQERSERASPLRDISELATRLLGPTGAAAGSGRQCLQGAGAYEQEAAKLQALAQQVEQQLWACSEHLEQARSQYQQLQTMVGATGAHLYDLQQAHQDMESLTLVMIQVREEYLTLMHRADQYLAAAAILRGAEHE